MDSNIYAFIISGWGILLNIGLLMASLAFAYDKYAKRWGATTGRFSTTGKITWSEYGGLGSSSLYDTTLISYTYRINNKAYNGALKGKLITQKQVDANPRGKEVRIFYAPRDPKFFHFRQSAKANQSSCAFICWLSAISDLIYQYNRELYIRAVLGVINTATQKSFESESLIRLDDAQQKINQMNSCYRVQCPAHRQYHLSKSLVLQHCVHPLNQWQVYR